MAWLTSKKALITVFGVFLGGSVYRAFHFYVTGFYVPDEFGYAYYHVEGYNYQSRPFFNLINYTVLPHNPDGLASVMPFYFMFWLSIGLLSAYRTMKLLHDDITVAKMLLLSLTLPVFLLFAVTVLTEPVAFAVAMFGIYISVWFWKRGSGPFRYAAPVIAALAFVAANYTRADFVIFQIFGWVPFVVAEYRRTKTGAYDGRSRYAPIIGVLSLFAVPAAFFLYWPNDSFTTTISTGTIALHGGQPTGPIIFSVSNGARLFIQGLVIGWNPVFLLLLAAGFFYVLYKRDLLTFWLGLLSILTFAGTSFIYSFAVLPLSTDLRYSYDALPAFFLLVPPVIAKMNGRKATAAIIIGLVVSGAAAATSYQTFFQSNLGANYPYLNGHQSFLTLDYRAPYAQLRDYFHAQPQQTFDVVGQTQVGYLNLTYYWGFTPGVSDIKVNFHPYSQLKFHNLTSFYLYIEPPNSALKIPADANYSVIYDTSSFYFAKVTLA